MPVEKLSLSFDAKLAKEIRRQAKRAKLSVSAWVAETARRALLNARMLDAADEFQRRRGAFTDEEIEETRRWLDSPSTPARSSRRSGKTVASGRSRSRRRARVKR